MDQSQATNETRRVIAEYLQHLGAGRYEAVASLYAEAIDWRLSWPDALLDGPIPWIRVRHHPADIEQHYRSIAEHNIPDGVGTTIETIIVEGTEAVVLGTIRNLLRDTRTPCTAHFALHLTVVHGAIARHHVYEDSLAVMQAWQGGERQHHP